VVMLRIFCSQFCSRYLASSASFLIVTLALDQNGFVPTMFIHYIKYGIGKAPLQALRAIGQEHSSLSHQCQGLLARGDTLDLHA